jgi:outer membrane protein assembly factor BamB
MTADYFCLPREVLKRTQGRLGAPEDGEVFSAKSFVQGQEQLMKLQNERQFIRMGANAIIGEAPVTAGGWKKPFYANTIARIFAIDEKGKRFVSVGGGIGTAEARGGGGDSRAHLLNMLDQPVKDGRYPRFVDEAWEFQDNLMNSRGLPSISALAVANNAVYLGFSVYGGNKHEREAAAEMPHRLRILDLTTGKLIRELPAPGRVLQGGSALAEGRIYVATEDGSITAFAGK